MVRMCCRIVSISIAASIVLSASIYGNSINTNLPSDLIINQTGCRIPKFDLFSSVIRNYYRVLPETEIDCDGRFSSHKRPPLLVDKGDELHLNRAALPYYYSDGVWCNYRTFHRHYGPADNVWYSLQPKRLNLNNPSKINEEFVEVECYNNATSKLVYIDYFAFVPRKKNVEARCESVENAEDSISVLVIGLDSLSRLQFHRQLNSSSNYLINQMEAIEMYGYNKVDEATYPNLVPVLSGMNQKQFYEYCLKNNDMIVDSCPLIFKKLQKRGYRTTFVEDAPELAIFNYGATGFNEPPSDYYLRPLMLEFEKYVGRKTFGCGNVCLGSRSSLEFLLSLAEKNTRAFAHPPDKYFAFLWSCCCTHDSFNYAPHVDAAVLQFLETMHSDDTLNHTVLIVMSDHGPRRIPEFKATLQGQYEKRLPLLTFTFPKWFQRKYSKAMENLRANAEKLTTHFDLHRTFFDLMDLKNIENSAVERENDTCKHVFTAGISLFSKIPSNRTCSTANIPSEFCTCENQTSILIN